jgi:hypothetical protein
VLTIGRELFAPLDPSFSDTRRYSFALAKVKRRCDSAPAEQWSLNRLSDIRPELSVSHERRRCIFLRIFCCNRLWTGIGDGKAVLNVSLQASTVRESRTFRESPALLAH